MRSRYLVCVVFVVAACGGGAPPVEQIVSPTTATAPAVTPPAPPAPVAVAVAPPPAPSPPPAPAPVVTGWFPQNELEPTVPLHDYLLRGLTVERIARREATLLRVGAVAADARAQALPADAVVTDLDVTVLWHPRFVLTGCPGGDRRVEPPLPTHYAIPSTERRVVVAWTDVAIPCPADDRDPEAAAWQPTTAPTDGEPTHLAVRAIRGPAELPADAPPWIRDFDFTRETLVVVGQLTLYALAPVRPAPNTTSDLALTRLDLPIALVECTAGTTSLAYYDPATRRAMYRLPASTRTLVVVATHRYGDVAACPAELPTTVFDREGDTAWVGLWAAEDVARDSAVVPTLQPRRKGRRAIVAAVTTRTDCSVSCRGGGGGDDDDDDHPGDCIPEDVTCADVVDASALGQLYEVRVSDLPVVVVVR